MDNNNKTNQPLLYSSHEYLSYIGTKTAVRSLSNVGLKDTETLHNARTTKVLRSDVYSICQRDQWIYVTVHVRPLTEVALT
jgi:hypothetical protein